MYKSPIDLLVTDIQHQIAKQQDEEIYKAVVHYVPNVDKEELIRALKYDRQQYERGYEDGLRDGAPKWIPVTERLPEYEGTYLVFTTSGCVTTARWFPERDVRNYRGDFLYHKEGGFRRNATHWMPLPEPPKGE